MKLETASKYVGEGMIMNNRAQRLKSWVLASCAASAIVMATPAVAQSNQTFEFDIEAKELGAALTDYGITTGNQVLFNDRDVRGKMANEVEGTYSSNEAVKLLLDDTGVEFRIDDNGTLLVGSVNPQYAGLPQTSAPETIRGSSLDEEATQQPFRVAQVDQEETVREATDLNEDLHSEQGSAPEEIVVTGTLLRGVNPTSPLIVLDREDINAGGFVSTQDFLRALPQNFDQGQNTAAGRAGDTGGAPLGSSPVNLRGLGNRSTLVLINGKRIAPGAGGSQFVDVNLIPLSAIERIEVLTDGASATYGTDAVAGVINLILNDDFVGSETRARFGAVTEGSSQQYALNQTLRTKWDSGNILGSFEYFRQNNLDSSEREFAEGSVDPVDLIPRRESYSGFVQLRQDINDNVSFFAEGLFSTSDSTSNLQFEASPVTGPGQLLFVDNGTDQYNINAGVDIDLSPNWSAEIYGTFSRNEGVFFQSRDGIESGNADHKSDVMLVEASVSGDLLSLPGGAAALAVGGQFRNEDFIIEISNPTAPIVTDADRDVYSIFAELYVPIIGDGNQSPGFHSLELSLSGRFEDYSDFGSTTNPKIGFVYEPTPGLSFRGTYGTSFIAPSYQQLFLPLNSTALPGFISPLPDGSPGPDYLFIGGGNPGLSPEEAETWTLGFDTEPAFLQGLRISGTYYNIDFTDRVGSPLNGSVRTLFTNPDTIDDRFIQLDPSIAEVEALFAGPFIQVLGGVTAADIGAIIDNRIQNIATTSTDGLDLNVEYARPVGEGQLRFTVNGSYILSSDQRATPNSDIVETINNFAQPVDFRLRSSVGWSGDKFSTTLFVNYVDDYSSDRVGDRVPVDSWTTFDYYAQYSFGEDPEYDFLSGVRLSLNVQNLFDEEPPFVDSGINGIFYDGNNASPLGRFVSLELVKRF